MKIAVCIKQVPDARQVRLDPQTNTLVREGVDCMVNPYDQNALEEAVRIKEAHGGNITVITMGPPQAETVLRDAVACGADEAVLVTGEAFAGADTLVTSHVLAKTITKLGEFDLILCGKQTSDGDTAQVGPGLATRLNVPFVTCVQKIRELGEQTMVVERMMDDGYDVVRMPLPALLTVVRDINDPRVPSLKGKMKAKKAKITVLNAEETGVDSSHIGLAGSPTQVVHVFNPEAKTEKKILTGTVDEQVDQLVEKLNPYL